ncbi:phosphatase PAP2 family protein [Streptomyces sp. ACA25]|uniref:phosphatase PAP2 family protein n=1 Tax=Streptomyces sp. ACA25 TaxID=3022596 RepID=UPI0023082D66|nr:phosphatase PAP2 family protein [Streptomyces sp. ACA25]MDB1087860.1 phosphatase PAP2 family protein [Streptomyces sp. ACA25]
MGATSVSTRDQDQVNAADGAPGAPSSPAGSSGPWQSLRVPRRPRLRFELLLIAISYWIYSLIRNAVPERVDQAQENARWIWEVQKDMGLAFEQAVNHAVNEVTWLIVATNYYYATLHFIVTIAVLVWLFRRHPGRYGATRLVLFATTAVALLGYYFYPLAPPRLMDGVDFIDTVKVHNTWGAMSSESLAEVSNQYAAMPSMHAGWSLWCGITVMVLARPVWLKVLGVLYPVLTLAVIVATANHFWLDAAGGIVCLAFGYAVAHLWYGRLCYHLPRQIPLASPAYRNGTQPPEQDVSRDRAPDGDASRDGQVSRDRDRGPDRPPSS